MVEIFDEAVTRHAKATVCRPSATYVSCTGCIWRPMGPGVRWVTRNARGALDDCCAEDDVGKAVVNGEGDVAVGSGVSPPRPVDAGAGAGAGDGDGVGGVGGVGCGVGENAGLGPEG